MNDVSIPPLWEKNKSLLTAPVTVVWGPGLAGIVVQSPLNCQLSKQTVCYWNGRICFPLGLKVICIEPWEFPSYQILKLSLLKQERDPRAWRFWVSGLDPLIMGAKGRSATSFNIWTAMFIEVGTEMPVASPLALATWAESSCVAAYPLITLMVDSSLEYQKFVATGFWLYREKGEEMGLQATYKVMSH